MRPKEFKRIREGVLGLSQQALADAFGRNRVTVVRWETGALKIPKLVALAMRLLEQRGGMPDKR